MKFTYSSGQRPLDGYTLKRGVGRGGFGEVYFAVSDGGKEVALKLVRGDASVELRGVAQCLNLKHPNLVNLYDLRTDGQGDRWVVMEYVAGEPLNVVLQRHPKGLPIELAREWFLGLAKAVGYLHDHGIVHRDLKPGNVFVENGAVKVGDYGLSKALGASQRTAQTQSVGTVHYMAPEISTGNYNKQIDVYAAGVILYEMLTGRVPFDGESAGEILMKHLTSPPDLTKVPAEYLPVVVKSLAKNPAQRYASMAEMARAVEAVGRSGPGRKTPPPPSPRGPAPRKAEPVLNAIPVPSARTPEPILTAMPAVTARDQIGELCRALPLTVLLAAVGTVLLAGLAQVRDPNKPTDWMTFGAVFFLTVAGSWAVLIPSKFWTERRGDPFKRRLVLFGLGGVVGLGALWLSGWSPGAAAASHNNEVRSVLTALLPASAAPLAGNFAYFALGFFALRWWRMTDRRRPQRFSFAYLLGAGFWGLLLRLLACPDLSWGGVAVLVLAAAVVQVVSPWQQPPAPPVKRMRLRYA
jgi:eukaryotic-like serine/threonine-protein kinase